MTQSQVWQDFMQFLPLLAPWLFVRSKLHQHPPVPESINPEDGSSTFLGNVRVDLDYKV